MCENMHFPKGYPIFDGHSQVREDQAENLLRDIFAKIFSGFKANFVIAPLKRY